MGPLVPLASGRDSVHAVCFVVAFSLAIEGISHCDMLLNLFHHCRPVSAYRLGCPNVLFLLFKLSSCTSLVSFAASLFLRLRNRFYSSLPKQYRRLFHQPLDIILSDHSNVPLGD